MAGLSEITCTYSIQITLSKTMRFNFTGREGPVRKSDFYFPCVGCGRDRQAGTWNVGFEIIGDTDGGISWVHACANGCAEAVRGLVEQQLRVRSQEFEASDKAESDDGSSSSGSESESGNHPSKSNRPASFPPAPPAGPMWSQKDQTDILLRRRNRVCEQLPRVVNGSSVQMPLSENLPLGAFLDCYFDGAVFRGRNPEDEATEIVTTSNISRYGLLNDNLCFLTFFRLVNNFHP